MILAKYKQEYRIICKKKNKSKACNKYEVNIKEILKSLSIPEFPWNRISIDIFTYGNKSHLNIVDAYSNLIELNSIKNKSALVVIKKFKDIFSKFRTPIALSYSK